MSVTARFSHESSRDEKREVVRELATQLGLLVCENRSLHNQLSSLKEEGVILTELRRSELKQSSMSDLMEGMSLEDLEREIEKLRPTILERLEKAQENEKALELEEKRNKDLYERY
jgi:hypothetical protein